MTSGSHSQQASNIMRQSFRTGDAFIMIYHRQYEFLPLHTLGTSSEFQSKDDLLTLADSCCLDATHLILQNLPPPFHGLCQSYNFMEGKELCFLGQAAQLNDRSQYCKHIAKVDTEKEPAHIGPTCMLSHRQRSFWLAAVELSLCTQPFQHQLWKVFLH